MKYVSALLAVKDIKASRKFYEDLFGLELELDHGENISFVGGISLQERFDELLKIDKDSVKFKSNNAELYFEEEDIDGFVERLKAYPDINYVHELREYPWGQRVIRFYDLDNHIIEVGENMKCVIERFLAIGISVEELSKEISVSIKDIETLRKG